ncbi:MAG: iron ABC transporter permease [Phycisphaerales bacterium]|nr:iron ABC transporter permease [Phycisphaerales bacterium]
MPARIGLVLLLVLMLLGLILRLVIEPGGRLGLPGDGVIWGIRLDRAIAAIIVGVALGAAGVALQAMLRNPLASPDLLGMSAGAVLAVTLGRALGIGVPDGAAALVGAIGALGLVLLLGRRRGQIEPVTLILVGVALAIGLGSLASAVRALLPPSARPEGAWMFGTLSDGLTTPRLALAGAVAIAGVVWIAARGRGLDAAAMGEDEALSTGVPLRRLRLEMLLVAGGLTAVAVVLAGPIAFLGLVCPHLVRLVIGPRHGTLVIGAAMAGAMLMLLSDSVVRVVPLETGRLPTGVVVAVLAAPALIVILRSQVSRPI